jgi:hypothetical protein
MEKGKGVTLMKGGGKGAEDGKQRQKKNCAQKGERGLETDELKGGERRRKLKQIMKERQRESRHMILVLTFFLLTYLFKRVGCLCSQTLRLSCPMHTE